MPEDQLIFEGNVFQPSAWISTEGDTIRSAYAPTARKGQIYRVQYRTKPGSTEPILTTQKESGEAAAGTEVRISPTSSWGKTINSAFKQPMMALPIGNDYSKKPWYSRWLYDLMGYKEGGKLNYLNYFN